jgi:hypothetical protein
MSDEHVFADWVSKHFGYIDGDAEFGYIDGDAEVWDKDGIQASWSGTAFQDTLWIVCRKPCNNEWMSQMEQAVAPILKFMMKEDYTTSLSPTFQGKLAAWAVKTVMVADYLPPDKHVVPEAQYREFYNAKLPLPAAGLDSTSCHF